VVRALRGPARTVAQDDGHSASSRSVVSTVAPECGVGRSRRSRQWSGDANRGPSAATLRPKKAVSSEGFVKETYGR